MYKFIKFTISYVMLFGIILCPSIEASNYNGCLSVYGGGLKGSLLTALNPSFLNKLSREPQVVEDSILIARNQSILTLNEEAFIRFKKLEGYEILLEICLGCIFFLWHISVWIDISSLLALRDKLTGKQHGTKGLNKS